MVQKDRVCKIKSKRDFLTPKDIFYTKRRITTKTIGCGGEGQDLKNSKKALISEIPLPNNSCLADVGVRSRADMGLNFP